jgi:hypothetical protein
MESHEAALLGGVRGGLRGRAHICVTDGQSYRLAQATAGKGMMPLVN